MTLTDPTGLESADAAYSRQKQVDNHFYETGTIKNGPPLNVPGRSIQGLDGSFIARSPKSDDGWISKDKTIAAVGEVKLGGKVDLPKGNFFAVAGITALDANVGLQTPMKDNTPLRAGFSAGMEGGKIEAIAGAKDYSLVVGAMAKILSLKGDISFRLQNKEVSVFGSIGLGSWGAKSSIGATTSIDLGLGLSLGLGVRIKEYAK